jgi:hypothetical protein
MRENIAFFSASVKSGIIAEQFSLVLKRRMLQALGRGPGEIAHRDFIFGPERRFLLARTNLTNKATEN